MSSSFRENRLLPRDRSRGSRPSIRRLPQTRPGKPQTALGVAEADVGKDAVAATRGSHQAQRPSRRSSTGTARSRTSSASSRTAIAEDDAHLLGRQRPGEREGEEHGDHDRGGGEDHAAGVGEPADHRLARVAGAVPVLLRRGEQEHRVVHRDREDHREEEDRPPRVEEALRLEAEQAGAVAVLEDQPGDAEGGAGGEQVRDDRRARRSSGACSATSRSRKPSASTTPITSGVFAASACSRSWFSAAAPPTSAPRRQRGAEPVDRAARRPSSDGSAFGTAWTSASPPRPGWAGETRAMPGSRLRRRPRRRRPRARARRSGARPGRRRRTPAAPAS